MKTSTSQDAPSSVADTLPINDDFLQILGDELALTREIEQVLNAEQSAIEEQQLSLLAPLGKTKNELLSKLQTKAGERLHQIERSNGQDSDTQEPNSQTMSDDNDNGNGNGKLNNDHQLIQQQCQQLYQALKEQYLVNQKRSHQLGEIVLNLRRRTQQKLAILRAKPDASNTYNHTGHSDSGQQQLGSIKA